MCAPRAMLMFCLCIEVRRSARSRGVLLGWPYGTPARLLGLAGSVISIPIPKPLKKLPRPSVRIMIFVQATGRGPTTCPPASDTAAPTVGGGGTVTRATRARILKRAREWLSRIRMVATAPSTEGASASGEAFNANDSLNRTSRSTARGKARRISPAVTGWALSASLSALRL